MSEQEDKVGVGVHVQDTVEDQVHDGRTLSDHVVLGVLLEVVVAVVPGVLLSLRVAEGDTGLTVTVCDWEPECDVVELRLVLLVYTEEWVLVYVHVDPVAVCDAVALEDAQAEPEMECVTVKDAALDSVTVEVCQADSVSVGCLEAVEDGVPVPEDDKEYEREALVVKVWDGVADRVCVAVQVRLEVQVLVPVSDTDRGLREPVSVEAVGDTEGLGVTWLAVHDDGVQEDVDVQDAAALLDSVLLNDTLTDGEGESVSDTERVADVEEEEVDVAERVGDV